MQPPLCYNLNMNVFTSVGILILTMLIMAFLQLSTGIFLLFFHYCHGKYSHRKCSDMGLFYIIGVELCVALIFLSTYFSLNALYFATSNFDDTFLIWFIAGILAALAIVIFFCYYHKGKNTKLFISRRLASLLNEKAKNAKTRSDAFTLGFISTIPELFFTIPIYIVAAIETMQIGDTPIVRSLLVILFILSAVTPIIAAHMSMDFGYNLANIEKTRIRNKNFTRAFVSLLYLIIAILIITFKVIK